MTKADIVLIAPELSRVPKAQFETAIRDAALQINRHVWGSKADLGHKYLAAHLVGLAHLDRLVAGSVQSDKVGEVAATYAASGFTQADELDATRFGREFKRLRRQLGLGIAVP